MYCILHLPLGTAMTYSLTSALFIALFSYLLFREFHGHIVLLAVNIGFWSVCIYLQTSYAFPLVLSCCGFVIGHYFRHCIYNAWKVAVYYNPRIIVLSFILTGVLVPSIFMLIKYFAGFLRTMFFLLRGNGQGYSMVESFVVRLAAFVRPVFCNQSLQCG